MTEPGLKQEGHHRTRYKRRGREDDQGRLWPEGRREGEDRVRDGLRGSGLKARKCGATFSMGSGLSSQAGVISKEGPPTRFFFSLFPNTI